MRNQSISLATLTIPYTICFCLIGDLVLLLYRNSPPNQYLWNGIGGKIEMGESVATSLFREIDEESEIDLSGTDVRYTGVVCWNTLDNRLKGMYCFVVVLPDLYYFPEEKQTREGILAWKELAWVFAESNTLVVSNIPRFLPSMLTQEEPRLYRCWYRDTYLQEVSAEKLPRKYVISAFA